MTRIDLPGGQWADVRGEADVLDEDIEHMISIIRAGDEDNPGMLMMKVIRSMAVQLVEKWSLVDTATGEPLPITREAFAKLPWATSRPIRTAVAPTVQSVMAEMNPDPKSGPSSLPSANGG